MRHILLATDGSSGGDRATEVAVRLANAMGAKLSIVTVGGTLFADEVNQLARAEGNIADALEAMANRILHEARQQAQRAGLSDVHVHSGWGDPAEIIMDVARREQVDAIVMGRRGRGRLAGLLLGSVSQKVATLAPCVVIIVP